MLLKKKKIRAVIFSDFQSGIITGKDQEGGPWRAGVLSWGAGFSLMSWVRYPETFAL